MKVNHNTLLELREKVAHLITLKEEVIKISDKVRSAYKYRADDLDCFSKEMDIAIHNEYYEDALISLDDMIAYSEEELE